MHAVDQIAEFLAGPEAGGKERPGRRVLVSMDRSSSSFAVLGARRGPPGDRSTGERLAVDTVTVQAGGVDATMRNWKLASLHRWLTASVPGYVGLHEAGSTTAGDPWVQGRSDRDVAIVFDGQILGGRERELRRQLPALEFNDTYLFYLVPRVRFLATDTDQDISMKFRGQVLFGRDLIAEKETPSRAFAAEIAAAGLQRVRGPLRICVVNAESWSLELLRENLYSTFKLLLMYLAAQVYAETGRYPRRRVDVGPAMRSGELLRIAHVSGRIDDASRQELIATTMLARDALRDVLGLERPGRIALGR